MVLLMELMPLEEEMVQKTSWEDYKLLLVSCHGETKKFVRCAKVVWCLHLVRYLILIAMRYFIITNRQFVCAWIFSICIKCINLASYSCLCNFHWQLNFPWVAHPMHKTMYGTAQGQCCTRTSKHLLVLEQLPIKGVWYPICLQVFNQFMMGWILVSKIKGIYRRGISGVSGNPLWLDAPLRIKFVE